MRLDEHDVVSQLAETLLVSSECNGEYCRRGLLSAVFNAPFLLEKDNIHVYSQTPELQKDLLHSDALISRTRHFIRLLDTYVGSYAAT